MKNFENELEMEEKEKDVLMKIEWSKEEIFDDGKQSDVLTGAAHPGCCKQ